MNNSLALAILTLAWFPMGINWAVAIERRHSPQEHQQQGGDLIAVEVRAANLDADAPDLPQLGAVRQTVIERLCELAASKERRGLTKYHAIEQLGNWRAVEATGLLIREIEFTEPLLDLGKRPLNSYPAAESLVKIGPPAIEGIFQRLRSCATIGEQELHIYAWVVYLIDGKELGLSRLEIATRANSQHAVWKRNSSRLAQLYTTTDFTSRQRWPRASNSR